MAIRLVIEVMDWAPPLTHREHKVLMILAENARLPSRETWDSVEDPKILRRAQLTRTQMYAVIAALVGKGCLVRSVWGGRDHRAKYKIARLAIPRTAQAQYEMYLARLSPAERQAVIYAERFPDSDHDQCPSFADTDHGSQSPGIGDADHDGQDHDQRPRKPGPRLPVGTGGSVAQAEGATAAEAKTVDAAEQRRPAEGGTPRSSATPPQSLRDHDGPEEPLPPVERNLMNGVQLQSPATAPIAREDRRLSCPVCGVRQRQQANGKLRRHGPQDAPCLGSGMLASQAAT